MTQPPVGIVGLGRMGNSFAVRLLDVGYDVEGYDVSPDARNRFADLGGTPRESAAAVAEAADIVFTSLPDSAIVTDVYCEESDGLLAGADAGTTAIETSTIDPSTMIDLAAAAGDRGVDLLGAPVSGGPEGAREGSLTILVGGDEAVLNRQPVYGVLDTLGSDVYHAGGIDAGHMLKLVNNTMTMGNMLLAMEAVSLGAARGVDGETLLEVLPNAGGASNQLRKRLPRVLNRNFEPGFTVDLGKKDVGIALDTAEEMNQPMLLTSLVHSLYTKASADGYGEEDIGAVVKLYEESRGITVEADDEVDESFEGY